MRIKIRDKKQFIDMFNQLFKNNHINKINAICIDSRKIKKNDIYIPIKGKKHDGHNYINNAINSGAIKCFSEKNNKHNKIIKINSAINIINKIAQKWKSISNHKIIGITGSNGKTTTKDLLYHVLSKKYSCSKSRGNYNSQIGFPISYLNSKIYDDYCILEYGANKNNEKYNLCLIIKHDYSLITNISYAHIKNFKNLTEIAKANSEIIKNIVEGGKIILNRDDNYFNFIKKIALKKNHHVTSYSKKNSLSDIYIKKITSNKINFKIFINIKNTTKSFFIKKNLHPYLHNILASVAIISEFYDLKNIDEKLFYNFKLPFSRGDMTIVRLKNKVIYFIDESYNSNPLSLKFAIENFNKQNESNKYLILGDMLELGKFSKILHKKMSKIINKTSIKKVYVIGKHIKETFYAIDRKKRGRILRDKNEIYQLIKNDLNNNDHLMIKASNSTGLNSGAANIKKGKIYAI